MSVETDELPEATALIATVSRLWLGACHDCQIPYRGPEVVFSIVMGFKDAPRCLRCLANGLKRDRNELQSQLHDYVQRRDCYRQAWEYANRREECEGACSTTSPAATVESVAPDRPAFVAPHTDFVEWNAGDMSCGDLVLALRIRLARLLPGSVLKIIARDPAAPEDLPAWCRLTGHTLLDYNHPEYYIRRKEN